MNFKIIRKVFCLSVIIFFISNALFADNKKAVDLRILQIGTESYNNPAKAIKLANSIIPEYEKKNDLAGIALLNRIIGIANENLSNYNNAIEFYTKSLRTFNQINDLMNVANSYNDIGLCYIQLSRYNEAKDLFSKALIIFNKYHKQKEIASVLTNIATCFQYTYDYKNSVKYLLDAIKLTEKLGDKEALATQFNNLAIIYKTLGNFNEALGYYQKSLKIFKELNDFQTTSLILNNIGNIYYHQDKYDKAIENYKESLILKQKIENKGGVANTYNNIGEVYEIKGDIKDALVYYNLALKTMEEIENFSGIIYTTNSIGKVFYKQKDYRKAELYFLRSLELGKIHSIPVKQTHYYLSEIYHKQNNFTKSLVHLQAYSELQDSIFGSAKIQEINDILAGYKISKKETELDILRESNKQVEEKLKERTIFSVILAIMLVLLIVFLVTITKNLRRINKIKNELNHVNRIQEETNAKLDDALDELRHEIGVRQIAELELRNSKEMLSKALEAEKDLNELKTKFVSMVTHEYRNPLTQILNTSELLKYYNKQNDSLNHELQIKNIKYAVDTMVKMLNDVLTLGKASSQTHHLQIVPIHVEEIFRNVITNVKVLDNNKHAFFLNIAKDVKFIISDPFHVTHVFTNLLSNAAKYSLPGSEILIDVTFSENNLNVKVSDKGIGIPDDDKKFLFQPFYRCANIGSISGTGLGLTIVKMFVELLKGDIKFESEENKGTTFNLTLPLDYNKL